MCTDGIIFVFTFKFFGSCHFESFYYRLGTELNFWLIEVNGLQTLSASSVMQM